MAKTKAHRRPYPKPRLVYETSPHSSPAPRGGVSCARLGEFLGTGTLAATRRKFLYYSQARAWARRHPPS